MKPVKFFLQLRKFCSDNLTHIKSAIGFIVFYIIIGWFMLLATPWKGWVHPHCVSCLSKSEMSLLILKFFNGINLILIAFIGLVTALNGLISMASSKVFGFFNMPNPVEEGASVSYAVITSVIIVLTSHFVLGILVAAMHHRW